MDLEALGKISNFDLPSRPFFSIIIPCYNSRETLPNLLESIVKQDMKDEIEVIISDDHSTEDYMDVLDYYKDKIYIILTQTDYNFAPGNTREKGVESATGQWLCFADHDDEFIEKTLEDIKTALIENNEQYLGIANFYEVNPETRTVIQEMKRTRNWNHAKFYNYDNLWKPFNIHFKKDLLTHEDIYISSCVNCALASLNGDNPLYIDIFCYSWMKRPTSISREKYGNYSFLETFFTDYIDSTGYAFLENFKNNRVPLKYAIDACIGVLVLSYFYLESFVFSDPVNYKKENFDYAKDYLIAVKEAFGISNEYIYKYVAANNAEFYEFQRKYALIATGSCMPRDSFYQWLDYLHHDIQPKLTMSQCMKKER